ncbi:MAG: hypothetical protein COA92_05185 [Sulfurovum sp.]|nr:MAG: hypothetical protein COA92_05185 [Sulfurovum sp.]
MKALQLWSSMLTAGLVLSGCGSDNNNPPPEPVILSYKVTVTNLTFSQPMTPMTIVYHGNDYRFFEVGESVSVAFENFAESGANVDLLTELSSTNQVEANIGGTGLILPGKSDTVMIEGESTTCISVATMLANTNDAFAGINCVDVSELQVGQQVEIDIVTYDAGTEANSELASTIPGPAGGGAGFAAIRDDRDFVSVHAGVVTKDDGLMTSVLTQMHKWDNPAASVMIERIN